MSIAVLCLLSVAYTAAAALLGALVLRAYDGGSAWRARRDLDMALATRARAQQVLEEARRVRAVYDSLPDYDPRRSWGAEVHDHLERLKRERDGARRDAEEWEEAAHAIADEMLARSRSA